MRSFERFLKVSGWASEYDSVQRLLDHLQRKTRSESSRLRYLETVYHLCAACAMSPAELVATKKSKLEELTQDFLDEMRRENKSVRYINVTLAQLVTFFRVNGFKNSKELELNRYTQPARYRKVPEYIPTSQEIERMANYAGSPKARALVLATYTSGLRNSTVRAVLYGDVKAEIEGGNDVVHVPVYPEMKRTDANAAKNSLPYSTFLCKEAVDAVKAYLDDFNHQHPDAPLRDDEPLFQGQMRGRPIKMRTLQVLVKGAARKSGIKRWKDVTPHCLRKAFENAIRNSGLDYKDQLFLEGHVLPGSEDPYLDKTRVEEFRKKYAQVVFLQQNIDPALVTLKTLVESRQLDLQKEEVLRYLGERLGIELPRKGHFESGTSAMVTGAMFEVDYDALRKEIFDVLEVDEKYRTATESDPQKVVGESELDAYLANGWQYVSTLGSGRIIIRHN